MALLELLEHLRNPILTILNMIFTVMGEGIFVICILCLILWCVDKNFGYRLCFIFITSGLAIQTLKISMRIERPFILNPELSPVKAAKKTATGYSFPSGHTQGATALFLTLFLNSKKTFYKIVFILPIILVGFSRMYLGVHTPYDVAVSFVITAIITLLIDYLFDNYSLDDKHIKWVFALILVIISVVTIYTFYLFTRKSILGINIENLKDVIQVAGLAFGFMFGWILEKKKIQFNEKAATKPVQIGKFFLGLVMLLAIKLFVSLILEAISLNVLLSYFIEYSIIAFFVVGLYPMIIKKFFTNEEIAYRNQ